MHMLSSSRGVQGRKPGFTIVELLIVIVVIAILAAISIVAYTGIQNRANDVKRVDDMAKIGKGLQLWSAAGNSLSDMNAGWDGEVRGWYFFDSSTTESSGSRYRAKSVHTVLLESGMVSDGVDDPTRSRNSTRNYMIALCTNSADPRRVLMAALDIPPEQTVSEQIVDSGCTHADISAYESSYNRNYARVF